MAIDLTETSQVNIIKKIKKQERKNSIDTKALKEKKKNTPDSLACLLYSVNIYKEISIGVFFFFRLQVVFSWAIITTEEVGLALRCSWWFFSSSWAPSTNSVQSIYVSGNITADHRYYASMHPLLPLDQWTVHPPNQKRREHKCKVSKAKHISVHCPKGNHMLRYTHHIKIILTRLLFEAKSGAWLRVWRQVGERLPCWRPGPERKQTVTLF